MQLQTFRAPTMAEALAQVKSSLGADAVILHTRCYSRRHWLGLRRQEVVEITAGRDLRVPSRPRRISAVAPQHLPANRAAASDPISTHANAGSLAVAGQRLLETPAANSVMIRSISEEMGCLRNMVSDLMREMRLDRTPQVPEELYEFYMRLTASEIDKEIACRTVRTTFQALRAEHLSNTDFVREKIAEQIEKLIPTSGPIRRMKVHGPHIVSLIGPTGVGKTTTIAKLAANLKLREHQRVGLITIDTYRIAAIDQLKKYADIIGAPLRVVGSPEDQRQAIESMCDCHYILIDTAGRSPNDTLKLGELKNFLNRAEPDEVHLVLSCTASQPCVELAVERFGQVRVDKLIFTKLDEAAHVGHVVNVIQKIHKPLSYVTTGQDVPDDIEVGKGRKLAEMILRKD